MKKKCVFGLGFPILAAAYIGLSSLTTPFRYYVTVSELVGLAEAAPRHNLSGERLKVVGTVQEGSFTKASKEDPVNRFTLEESGHRLTVAYRGPLPEQFHEGRQVVANGHLTTEDHLLASEVLVKCASKYEVK